MIPFTNVGIEHEPLIWELISHQVTDDVHNYEFRAASRYKGYSYFLKAVDCPREQKQYLRIKN